MKYTLKCPMCEEVMTVEADTEEEAMKMMKEKGTAHMMAMHKDAPTMTEEESEKMIKENWKAE